MSQNPYSEVVQTILTNEIGRRLFSSFPLHNNASFSKNEALKAEAAIQMLSEKTFPSIILSEIDSKEKKGMFMQALEVNIKNLTSAYTVMLDFLLEKQAQFPKMEDLWPHLQGLVPKKDKK